MKPTLSRALLTACFACLSPELAFAHPGGPAAHGWTQGFNHPLHGLDHIAVMIAVGAWAAQQGKRATWLLPLTFLAVMAAGGIVGALGFAVPGAETAIGLSVVVLGLLVLGRKQLEVKRATALVALFAFFHGYAHGVEMPGAASLGSYGVGFLCATTMLHGVGVAAVALGRSAPFALRRRSRAESAVRTPAVSSAQRR